MTNITTEELGNWLTKNKISAKEIFKCVDKLLLDGIPSLSWRFENKYESLKNLTELVNILKLNILDNQ